MADPSKFGEKTAEHSRLEGLPTAPPAYDEPSAVRVVQPPNVQPPIGQPQAQMGQYPQYPQQVQVGGVPPQTWPAQGYQVPQVTGQMPAMVVAPPPNYEAPHDFLILSLVTTIICSILILISMAFGIPAIILAVLSMNAKNNKNYPQAKQYGRSALILTLINIIFTMFLVILTVGLSVGFACAYPSNYAYYYSSNGCQ